MALGIRPFLLVFLALGSTLIACSAPSPSSVGGASATPMPKLPALPTTPKGWAELYSRLQFGMPEADLRKTVGAPSSTRQLSADEAEWTFGESVAGLVVEVSKGRLTRATLQAGPVFEDDLQSTGDRIRLLATIAQVFQIAPNPTAADLALTRGEIGGYGPSGMIEYRSGKDERLVINVLAGRVSDVDYRGPTPPKTMRLLREWSVVPIHSDAKDIFKDNAGGAIGAEFKLSGRVGEEVRSYYATELEKAPFNWMPINTTTDGPTTRLKFNKKYGAELINLSVVITQEEEYTLVQIFASFPGAMGA